MCVHAYLSHTNPTWLFAQPGPLYSTHKSKMGFILDASHRSNNVTSRCYGQPYISLLYSSPNPKKANQTPLLGCETVAKHVLTSVSIDTARC